MIFSFFFFLTFLTQFLLPISAHGRWKCPIPRDDLDESGKHIKFDNTGNKYAACGPQSGKWGFGKVEKLTPGWNTLTFEESINHAASPFRIAILDETETARVVLLDHIPHYEDDIKCSKCVMQLLYVMTDKTVKCGVETCYYNPQDAACKGSTDPDAETCAGAPNDQPCVAENECFSNYHSCFDFSIDGTYDISSFPFDYQPADWPFKSMPMSYYGAEKGSWSNGWLQGVPSNYTTDFGVNAQC